jgi:hypothetical protein
MGWKSPATVLRRHYLDQFPLYFDKTKRGLVWVTSDALIDLWETEKAKYSGHRLKTPWKRRHKAGYQSYNWRLRGENQTDNGTGAPLLPAKKAPTIHERPQKLKTKGCTCGTEIECTIH